MNNYPYILFVINIILTLNFLRMEWDVIEVGTVWNILMWLGFVQLLFIGFLPALVVLIPLLFIFPNLFEGRLG